MVVLPRTFTTGHADLSDPAGRRRFLGHLDESETLGAAGEPVGDDGRRLDGARLLEQRPEFGIRRLEREPPYIQLATHGRLRFSLCDDLEGIDARGHPDALLAAAPARPAAVPITAPLARRLRLDDIHRVAVELRPLQRLRRGRRRRFVGHLDEGETLWPAAPVARDPHRHKFAKRREYRSKICYGCVVS